MMGYSQERLHRPVLVLNSSYEPINVCAARRALVLVLKGVASAEEVAAARHTSSLADAAGRLCRSSPSQSFDAMPGGSAAAPGPES